MNQLRGSTATWKIWGNSLGTLDLRADPQNLPEGLTKRRWPADTFAQIGSGDSTARTIAQKILGQRAKAEDAALADIPQVAPQPCQDLQQHAARVGQPVL